MFKSFALLVFILQSCARHVLADDDEQTKVILGGTEVEVGRYSYQVALVSSSGNIVCGGSLVAENWVLSAARCAGAACKASIGSHDLTVEEAGREEIDIDCEIKHPDYDDWTLDNDYMMIRLKGNSTFPPVTLDDGSNVTLAEGDDLTIMGWGTTSSGGSVSNVLLEAQTDYVTNSECNDDYDPNVITSNMMCAARDGIASCQGDFGGPVIVNGDEASADIQVGIVSFRLGCADRGYPGVYARVSEKIDWINEQMTTETRAKFLTKKILSFMP